MTEIIWMALNVDEDPEEMQIFLTYSLCLEWAEIAGPRIQIMSSHCDFRENNNAEYRKGMVLIRNPQQ